MIDVLTFVVFSNVIVVGAIVAAVYVVLDRVDKLEQRLKQAGLL